MDFLRQASLAHSLTHLGVLQDIVYEDHPSPGIEQFLNIRVQVEGYFLVLVDPAELWQRKHM